MCEHAFVTAEGHPRAVFRRAIERGNYLVAVTTAREIGQLSLDEALELLLLIATKEPERFERAAARWHARFVLETRAVDVADAQLLLGAVAGLREPVPRVQLETIALVAERYKVSSVARVARRCVSSR